MNDRVDNIRRSMVMDNYGTHKVSKVRTLARHPRYRVHFTPTSGSWLNPVERLFAEVTARCVRRGNHTTVRELCWSTWTGGTETLNRLFGPRTQI